jgi:hypothetical protein
MEFDNNYTKFWTLYETQYWYTSNKIESSSFLKAQHDLNHKVRLIELNYKKLTCDILNKITNMTHFEIAAGKNWERDNTIYLTTGT